MFDETSDRRLALRLISGSTQNVANLIARSIGVVRRRRLDAPKMIIQGAQPPYGLVQDRVAALRISFGIVRVEQNVEPTIVDGHFAALEFDLLRFWQQSFDVACAFFAVVFVGLDSLDLFGGAHDSSLVIEQPRCRRGLSGYEQGQ